jgi:hypothetical protein
MFSAPSRGLVWLRLLLACLYLIFACSAAWAQKASGALALPVVANGTDDAPLPPASWRFVVSGDSRNCGDIVMPTIAAQIRPLKPAFYWHLGDLRAIYKIDEDIQFSTENEASPISCTTYQRLAWSDFVDHQIRVFGDLPFYLGIGNHEVIPPKNKEAFRRQFYDFLDVPALRHQRLIDHEPDEAEPYYHWIQGGVDFIYLDNANGFFSENQLTWFFRRLNDAMNSSDIKTLVIGMHEALPDSVANNHSMGDISNDPRGDVTGSLVYNALLNFNKAMKVNAPAAKDKFIYVLASHSHFYMENIFNSDKLKKVGAPLPGWIAGTAGAERYALPDGFPPSPTAVRDTYGYLLGTVKANGEIEFAFKPVEKAAVPSSVQQRYPEDFISWCFEKNSKNQPKDPKYAATSCPLPLPDANRTDAEKDRKNGH